MEKRLPKLIRFALRVFSDFFLRNHGLLLTAAVAYNMMLSLIPLSLVLMVVSSLFFEPDYVVEHVTTEVALIAPGMETTLKEVLAGFIKNRSLIGWLGLGSLMIFSSLAFRVMEDAFSILFARPLPSLKRKFWVSALMPYLFILIVTGGLILITAVNALVDAQGVMVGAISSPFIYIVGLGGLILLFSLFYKIMPTSKVSFQLALAGGVTATLLWEIVRHLLVAYYNKFSSVSLLYGSMATIIVVLLTLEAMAFILLLGAQVIADLQRSRDAKVPWYVDPDRLGE
jgi:membrane protein